MRHPEQLPASLLREAFPLNDILGVYGDAWTRRHAHEIIELLIGRRVVVLGGEVLSRTGDRLRFTSDNWHFDPEDAGDWLEQVRLSHARARGYIGRYPDPEDGSILYVLTLAQDSDSQSGDDWGTRAF